MGLGSTIAALEMMAERLPLTPEILVPRIGDVLVEKGLVTNQQLQLASQRQEEQRRLGKMIPFGQLLVEMGFIDRPALDEAVTEQILSLRAALQDANYHLERRVEQRTAELQEALDKLSELNQLKSNFLSNISHELRTPLTHVKGYLDLLSSQELGPLTEDQQHALSVMIRSSQRLERLIEDLILFSTISRGETSIHLSDFNLATVCEVVYRRILPKASDKQVSVQLKTDIESAMVSGDEEKIAWVLTQLLDNAVKFTPAGKTIWLDLIPEERYVRIVVRDEGIGIPQEKLDEIFEIFHQLDGTSTRRFGGTGLGLALARRIVEAHGSLIKVSSQVGTGSQFEFVLQRAQWTARKQRESYGE